jgi:hypothetical protein
MDKRFGMRALLILIFIDVVGSSFKILFHQPRPYWIDAVKELTQETSYGIPSTHASNSLAVAGDLAYRVKKELVLGSYGRCCFLYRIISHLSGRPLSTRCIIWLATRRNRSMGICEMG